MRFREYRTKETIRAAEITEEMFSLPSYESANVGRVLFEKGDYVILDSDGELSGQKKAEFELAYIAVRATRRSRGGRKRLIRVATSSKIE